MNNRFGLSLLLVSVMAATAQAGLNLSSLGNIGGWTGSPVLQTTTTPFEPTTVNLVSQGAGTTAVALTIRTESGFTLDKFAIVGAGGSSNGILNIYPSPVGGTEADGFVNLSFSTSLVGGGAGLPFTFNGNPGDTVLEFDLTGSDQITLDPNTLYAFDFKPADPVAGWDFYVRRGLEFYGGVGNIYALDISDPNGPGAGGERYDVGSERRDAAFALYAPATGQTVMWESFEDPGFIPVSDVNTGWGWRDFSGLGGSGTVGSTGVTDGSNALTYVPASSGTDPDQGLTFKLQDLTEDPLRRAEAYQGFINNTHIAFDVTWDDSDWTPIDPNDTSGANNFSSVHLIVNYGPGGNLCDGGGFCDLGAPDVDTGNPDFPGNWDRVNYTGVHTRTVMWDYSDILADIQDPNDTLVIDVTNGFLEFIITTQDGGNYIYPVAYSFDNFRFLTPTTFTPGDFDQDNDVDGDDFLLWQRDPGVGNLSDWEDNYGTVTTPLQASSAAVPEPTSVALLLVAIGLGGTARSRRQRH